MDLDLGMKEVLNNRINHNVPFTKLIDIIKITKKVAIVGSPLSAVIFISRERPNGPRDGD